MIADRRLQCTSINMKNITKSNITSTYCIALDTGTLWLAYLLCPGLQVEIFGRSFFVAVSYLFFLVNTVGAKICFFSFKKKLMHIN